MIEEQDPTTTIPSSVTRETAVSMPEQEEESQQDFVDRHVLVKHPYDHKDDLLDHDPALRLVSSEVGLLELSGQAMDDAAVATGILLERSLDTAEGTSRRARCT